MKRIAILLLFALVIGCSGGNSSEANKPTEAKPNKEETPKLTIKYQGMYADKWAEKLYDADRNVSLTGAKALQKIGEEACPFFIKGMDSDIKHVEDHSITYFPLKYSAKHKDQLTPVIKKWIGNNETPLQRRVIYFVQHGKITEFAPDLKKLTTSAKYPQVKRLAQKVLDELPAS